MFPCRNITDVKHVGICHVSEMVFFDQLLRGYCVRIDSANDLHSTIDATAKGGAGYLSGLRLTCTSP